MKNSGLNTCIWLALYVKYIFFLQKALWKLTNAKNVPLRTGPNNVCTCERSHGSRLRQRPGHHNKPWKNGGVFKKFFMVSALWWKGRATQKTVERYLYTSSLNHWSAHTHDVTIVQTWEFLIPVCLCLFVCNFAAKLAFVPNLLTIVFAVKIRCQFHPHSFYQSFNGNCTTFAKELLWPHIKIFWRNTIPLSENYTLK